MDPIVPAFLAVLLAETGSKTQALAHAQGLASRSRQGLIALLIASLGSYGVAAFAGQMIGARLPLEARGLLLAVALLASGLHMLTAMRTAPPLPEGAGLGRALLGFIKTQFGDDAQLLVFAFAVQSGAPALALSGGVCGVLVAGFFPMAVAKEWPVGKVRWARRIFAALLIMTGFILGVKQLGLSTAL